MFYDEEAVIQDADIEQAELEREGRYLASLRKRGICTHSGVVGLGADGTAHYPEAEGLTGAQLRCTDGCGEVFADADDWHAALAAL